MSEFVCPNGHPFPSPVAVSCDECDATVACEPAARGMALHAQVERLDAAIIEATGVGREAAEVARDALQEVKRLRAVNQVQTGALRRARRWLLAAQAQATPGRRSTIDAHIRDVDDALREATR